VVSKSRSLFIVAAHFALSCAISWSVLWGCDVSRIDDGWNALATNPLLVVVKFGPSIAGLIVLALFGSSTNLIDFHRRLLDIRRPVSLLGVVAFAAIATLPAAAAIAVSRSIEIPVPTAAMLGAAASWTALRSILGGGLGEEIGWRGVALPALLAHMGPRRASLIVGVLWTLWHAPAFFGSESSWWILLVAQAVLTISLSFVFTWVFLKTDGSLPVAILLHGALNGFNAWAETDWIPALDDIGVWQIVRILLVAVFGVVAAVSLPRRQVGSTGG